MRSITIHGLEDPLNSLIEQRAHRQGTSLNKTIKQLLAEALGISQDDATQRQDFKDLHGSWSAEDLEEFTRHTQDFSTIDPNDWK